MPDLDGLEATARRIAADPALDDVRVLILTTFELDEYVFDALRAGASGFLLKDTEPDELLRAVRVVAAGERLAVAPASPAALIGEFVARPERVAAAPLDLAVLTDREREVLALVAARPHQRRDRRGAATSARPRPAPTSAGRMMKLHARDRAQLVVLAYESGLVKPSS